jgi:purine-cytosine permease-like protein
MVAGVNRAMDPGLMAWEAAGIAGLAAVVIAGWTTANPTLYRAGLALQSVTPDWPRWKITLAAGLVTSVLACFPVFFMKLLDYVALYGLALMPIGAVVVAEHWILPRLGIEPYRTERSRADFNWNALIVWAGTLVACWFMPIHLFFRWLPGYFLALIAYVALEAWSARAAQPSTAAAGQVRS